jgi:hypothetical protein
MTKEIKVKYEELKETKDKNIWAELIIIYIQEVVLKYANPKFKETFRMICVAVEPKSGLINYIIDTTTCDIDKKEVIQW